MKNKKKKIIARIGAILACVLLVGSLAIPAFADYADGVVERNQETAFNDFNNAYLDDRAKCLALNQFMTFLTSIYQEQGDLAYSFALSDFFNFDVMWSGNVPLQWDGPQMPQSTYIDGRFYGSGCIWINGNYYAFHREIVTVTYGWIWEIRTPQLSILGIVGSDGITRKISAISEINNPSVYYPIDEITSFSAVFALERWTGETYSDHNEQLGIATFADLLFPDDEYFSSPRAFWKGFNSVNSKGAYDRGYDDAVADIDSGEFGKNFLGGVFSAPFDALNSFTLVQWTTDGGNTITISLGTVISAGIGIALFIWFLKSFAGG